VEAMRKKLDQYKERYQDCLKNYEDLRDNLLEGESLFG